MPIAATEEDIPTNAEIGDLGIYLGMEEPLLMEYMEFNVPSLFVVLIDSKAYAYVHEENDLDFFIQMFGDIGMKKGWNIVTNNDEDELPDIAESINYSEDIFCYTNASFSGDENEFNELNKYLGYFYRSTPW